jgi:hypothetical protein
MKRGYERGYTEADGRITETSREYVEDYGYDNNFNIVRKRSYVGEIDIYHDEDEEEQIPYCKKCYLMGIVCSWS